MIELVEDTGVRNGFARNPSPNAEGFQDGAGGGSTIRRIQRLEKICNANQHF